MTKPEADSESDYATPVRLAMYLEIGWSDYLLPESLVARPATTPGWPDPKQDAVRPDFYITVAEACARWSNGAKPRSACDVGASVGRLSYELVARLSGLEEAVLVEPSTGFSTWARHLLCDTGPLPPVPLLHHSGRTTLGTARSRPAPPRIPITVIQQTSEQLAASGSSFDVVTCLNVADRHPDPKTLARSLAAVTKPGGLLVCSSPLDFKPEWTPLEAGWTPDLKDLFPSEDWSVAGELETYYEFRGYNRSWTRFNCQVLGLRRRTA